MKKILSALLAVIMMIVMCAAALPASAEEARAAGISIDKRYLRAGDTLTVSNPGHHTLRYYVGDNEVAGDSFTLLTDYYEKWISVKAFDGETLVSEDRAYFSKLPVLYIDTEDGADITSKDEYKSAAMYIQNNTSTSAAVYSGEISIKGRGNSSWLWPKKPYRIKLDKKTNLFGMGQNKNWVLLANYLDESLLRNTTGFRLSEQFGLTATETVWTDVVLNGEYAGNYQLCEQIRVDSGRVDIFDWEDEAKNVASAVYKAEKKKGNKLDKDALETCLNNDLSWITDDEFTFNGKTYTVSDYFDLDDDISGGYLFELSDEYDEVSRFRTRNQLKVMLKSPEYLSTNTQMFNYVKRLWQDLEDAYMSEDGYADTAEGRKHFSQIVDLDSIVSYWLVMEIMGNNDAFYKSRYAYIDKGGLIEFGPVWDFDWGCGSLTVGHYPTGWKISNRENVQAFYKDLTDDPVFICRATELYWQVRPYLQSLAASGGILDTEIEYLRESGMADEVRWNREYTWHDAARGFSGDTRLFKSYLRSRIAWLDVQFSSDDTLIGSLRTEYSANPYDIADDELTIGFRRGSADSDGADAPADAVIGEGANAVVKIAVSDPSTVSLNVYLNGLYFDSFAADNGSAVFMIPDGCLLAENGRKNVISVIGKDSADATTYTNFATLKRDSSAETILCGDADRDGTVGILDATCIQRWLAGYEVSEFSYDAADISGKGLSVLDAAVIQRFLADLPTYAGIGELI